MNFGLSQEQAMIVDTVREFVEREVYPHEDMVERSGEVPEEIAAEIKRKVLDLGFYACNFPEEVGGAGLGHVDFALVERELGRGSMALTHFFGRPQNILMACEGDQRERYLLPAVRGEKMDALAMTEPGAGSDIRGMTATAWRDGGDWVFERHQALHIRRGNMRISLSFLWPPEKTRRPKGRRKVSPLFWSTGGTPGFTIRDGYQARSAIAGIRTVSWNSPIAACPTSQVLGEVDGGFAVMNDWLYATRFTVAAQCQRGPGTEMFLIYAVSLRRRSAKQFGQEIAKFQGVSRFRWRI